jgi:PAS domain S-box-containing protein
MTELSKDKQRRELSEFRRKFTELEQLRSANTGLGKQLAQTISLLNATIESTADGLLVVDNEGKIVSYNRKFLKLWKIPESLAEKKNDSALLDFVLDQLKDPTRFLKKVQHLYSHPEEESFDVIKFKDGRVFERFSQPQRIGNNIAGRVWSFRDITERAQAEETVRSLTVRYNALLASIPDIIMEMDNNKIYTWSNKAGIEFFGDYIIGEEANFYDEVVRKTSNENQALFTGDKDDTYVESWQIRKDGERRLIAWWVRVLKDSEENVFGALSIARDITEKKLAEDERVKLVNQLQNAIYQVKQLSGMLPICCSCKKIRDDKGYWNQIKSYIHEHSDAAFSHGICLECTKKYSEYFADDTE